MSCESQVEPLQLRFSNVTLTNDGQANLNGIALQIGSPEQIIALTPSTLLSNTVLANRETCGSTASVSCIAAIGGGFDASTSSSFRATTFDSWNGSSELGVDFLVNQPATYFNDILTVASNQSSQSLPGFPLLLSITKTAAYSELGLGRNSTFVSRLHEAGLIPSRSWSFLAGVYSRIKAGSLIFGGYSDRFYQGTLLTSNVLELCDTCFEVASMNYQQDGSTTSLMPDGNTTVIAAVDPYFLTMSVSEDMFFKFGNATNGTVAPLWHTYSPNAVPTGNVTITLANGLVTTIPNHALFNPPAYDNGALAQYHNGSSDVFGVFSNSSGLWLQQATTTSTVVVFGMPYAAMVYLVRDYERQTVGIANANQDAQIAGSAIPICPLHETSHPKANHTGAIVGGVIGGIVALVLIIFAAWFLRRRKKRSSTSGSYANVENILAREVPGDDKKENLSFEKPAGSTGYPQEASTESSKYEVAGDQSWRPYEMPAEGTTARSELPAWKEEKS